MLPLSDGLHPRRFPIVNVALITANFAVWLFYELPHLNSAVYHASFYSCTVNGSCHGPEPWGISWLTAMFMHCSWSHILGNMLFLAIFGKSDDDANRGHPAVRHGGCRTRPQSRSERRDRRRPRRLLHPLPDRAHPDAGARLLRPDPRLGLPRRLVRLPARRGTRRPHLGIGERRGRRVLRAH